MRLKYIFFNENPLISAVGFSTIQACDGAISLTPSTDKPHMTRPLVTELSLSEAPHLQTVLRTYGTRPPIERRSAQRESRKSSTTGSQLNSRDTDGYGRSRGRTATVEASTDYSTRSTPSRWTTDVLRHTLICIVHCSTSDRRSAPKRETPPGKRSRPRPLLLLGINEPSPAGKHSGPSPKNTIFQLKIPLNNIHNK